MKKTLSLLALLAAGVMVSCEADTNLEETEALFENIEDIDSPDTSDENVDKRES
ncbi:MAG: hypothetical protein AAGB24_16010 [Bacteroidota bacterium]